MIVPRTALLVAFVLIAGPAAVLGSMPSLAPAAWLLIALFAVVAALDAVLGIRSLRGISVRLPDIVRFVRRRKSGMSVVIRNGSSHSGRIHVGIALPDALGCERDEFDLRLPTPGESAMTLVDCTPTGRGTFPMTTVAVERASPLRLWSARRRLAAACEARVYPDLGADRSVMAPLLMRRNPGVHVQRQLGRGREFEKLRDYIPGDALNEIHWKATARRHRLVTRTFRIERTQEVYAVLDCSRLTGRPAEDGDSVLEHYISAALVLALAGRQQGDLFGLVTFSDAVHSFVRAGGTPAHYDACRNALLNLAPRAVAPDYAELFATLEARLRRRALLLFMTELDDPAAAEDFLRGAGPLARHHLVAVASVRDASMRPLFTSPASSVAEVYERLGGHLAWKRLEQTGANLRARGVQLLPADAPHLALELTRFYLNARQRQAV